MTVDIIRFVDQVASIGDTSKREDMRSLQKLVEVDIEKELSWLSTLADRVSSKLGKKVNPLLWEECSRITPFYYRSLSSSLVHSIRNSIDHGIEMPETRVSAGKDEFDAISLALSLSNDTYKLVITDDGTGYQGDIPEGENLTELTFKTGFTTKNEVTELSGRGLGLSAIAIEVEKLGGSMEMESEKVKV